MAATNITAQRPRFSFIVPTYNSAATLGRCLASIRSQNYDQSRIEILVVDGGSSDDTRDIAATYGVQIVDNPRRHPESAKLEGLKIASGDFVVFHDSDEVIVCRDSLSKRVRAFTDNDKVWNVAMSGLVAPAGYSKWCDYANVVGDPFSRFLYQGGGGDAAHSLIRRYPIIKHSDDYWILKVDATAVTPLLDACSHTFRRDKALGLFGLWTGPAQVSQVAHRLISASRVFAVLHDDFILHYSSSDFATILRKIQFRVINNLFNAAGGAGFANRAEAMPLRAKLKKYAFIPYTLSILWPLWDGLKLAIIRRNPVFLAHPLISLTTTFMILFYLSAKVCRMQIRPPRSYGSK